MGFYQKQVWKNSEENSEKINRGDPYLKKPTLGYQRKKSKKKNLKKNIFLLKVSGYMVYIIEIFLENFEKKKFWKKKIWKKILKKKVEKKNVENYSSYYYSYSYYSYYYSSKICNI